MQGGLPWREKQQVLLHKLESFRAAYPNQHAAILLGTLDYLAAARSPSPFFIAPPSRCQGREIRPVRRYASGVVLQFAV